MHYGSLVENDGRSADSYASGCHGCVDVCPLYGFSHQTCQQSDIRRMYESNGQKACCLMRKSNSASVSISHFTNSSRDLPKNFSAARKCQNESAPADEVTDGSESEDSDAEFAVHECLRDLIKSRSVQAFQARERASGLTSDDSFAKSSKNAACKMESRVPDVAQPAPETVNAQDTQAHNVSSDVVMKPPTVTCWSAPDSSMTDEGNENSDAEEVDSDLDSPKDYCWSAPELASNDLYSSSLDEDDFLSDQKSNPVSRERLSSLPGSIFSDYDEPKRPSFLALDKAETEERLTIKMPKKALPFPKTLALEESYNSMDIYVASPSPQREFRETADKETHGKCVEKAEEPTVSASDIEFIDSPDDTEIPFGYENFITKLRQMQNAAVDENRNRCTTESSRLNQSFEGSEHHGTCTLNNCTHDDCRCNANCDTGTDAFDEGESSSGDEEDPEIGAERASTNEDNSQNIKEILKQFKGFKPLRATSSYCITNREVEECSKLWKSPSSTVLKEFSQGDAESCAVSANKNKLEQNASEKIFPNQIVRLSSSKLRRSQTDNKLSDPKRLSAKPKSGFFAGRDQCNAPCCENKRLIKSATLGAVSKLAESTKSPTSSRRRLPPAPKRDVKAKQTSYGMAEQEHNFSVPNDCRQHPTSPIYAISSHKPLHCVQPRMRQQEHYWSSLSEDYPPSVSRNYSSVVSPEAGEDMHLSRCKTHAYPCSYTDYIPSPSRENPDEQPSIYQKGYPDYTPCYGDSCFTAPFTPGGDMAIFDDLHYVQRHSRNADNENALERPTSLPFNGLIRSSVSQRNNPSSLGHRQLPPLPVNSRLKDIFIDLSQLRIPGIASRQYIVNRNMANDHGLKEGHRICFDTDSMIDKSTDLLGGSYFEDNTVNGNYYSDSKTMPLYNQDDSSGISSCCTGSEHLNSTHRVVSAFAPRHDDEVSLEVGDSVHVEREYDDHWCYGTNLRTAQQGIFPVAHVCEVDFSCDNYSAMPSCNLNHPLPAERDTFYLTMLASIEVAHHKGNDVLLQAMNKVLSLYKNREEFVMPVTVLMEITFRGIHIIDKSKRNFFQCPNFDFFYSLQNISFCGAHPQQLRYFGFITKHPLLPRFACHVFLSNQSTQIIVEAIGRAFKRSYDEYMAFAHPTEDIYLE